MSTAWPNGAPAVGAKASRTRTVADEDIELFSRITGDRNPLHYDEELASRSRFGGIIVQGGVTSGLLNAVVAEDLPGPGSVFLKADWSFLAPVRPGDTITATVELTSVRADKPIVEMATRVERDDGTVVLEGSAVCFQDPTVAAESGRRA
jgi:acyl dehydratase